MDDDQNAWTDPDDEREAAIKALVERTDLSPLQAKALIAQHGTDKDVLFAIAATMKAEG
jgi:hypothetical protein